MSTLALTAVLGCSSRVAERSDLEPAASASQASVPGEFCEAELGATEPVHAAGQIYLAGQPQPSDIQTIAQRGVKTIVTLRKPEELDWDEEAAVKSAGMTFVAVPFDGPGELTDDVFDRVRKALNEHRDAPLVLHCGRANRVGAVWMAHRVLDEGVGIDQALEEAKAAGLRTPGYVEKAQDYIRRTQAAQRDPARNRSL
jgi:uncharacterized protein (TIGR01244 family)